MNNTRNSLIALSMLVLLIGLVVSIMPVGVVHAQEATPPGPTDDQVNAIAKQLYCPVCENIPLDVCPTQACAQWRALIRERLAQGWTEDQIKTYFAAQYGDRVLATPPARGLNWLVYVIPPLAIVGGGYILFRALRAWRQLPVQEEVPSPAEEGPEDEYLARIEEELRRR
jgi:cytochrome c-type biogenesis protein CcmH